MAGTDQRSNRSHQAVLDAIDYRIIAALQQDGRLKDTDLSKLLQRNGFKIGSGAVGRRVQRLQTSGYIAKTVALIDYEKFEAGQAVFITVKLGEKRSAQDIDAFILSATIHPDVVECYSLLGTLDFILKVRVANVAEAMQVSAQLGEAVHVESLPVCVAYKDTTAIDVPRHRLGRFQTRSDHRKDV